MRNDPGILDAHATRRTLRKALVAGLLATIGVAAIPQTASAQFFFWDQPRFSADDVARSVIERGYRPLMRPVRNEGVYVADVIDRRGQHERLIVSADTGEIVQRFYVDYGHAYRRDFDASIPRGPIPPGRIPDEGAPPHRLTRAFPGADDQNMNAAPPFGGDRPLASPPRPKPRVKHPRPRIVERAPEPARAAPIESAPLAPPASSAPKPTAPAVATPAPSDRPVRSITTNPLAIPGTREKDEKPARSTAAAAPSAPAAPKPVAPKPAVPAAKPATPASQKDVPVAPLD